MSGKPTRAGRVRRVLWAAGTLICLAYYGVQAVRLPATTPVGVEHPLLPLGEVRLSLHESPGGRWVLSTYPGDDMGPPPAPPTGPEWPRLSALSPRRLLFGVPFGTWSADGWGLHRVWRFAALGWAGGDRLWATAAGDPWTEPSLVLDLKTGRTEVKPEGWENPYRYGELDWASPFAEDDTVSGSLTSILEKQPADFRPEEERSYRVGGRSLSLLWGPGGSTGAVYAASHQDAQRLLRLAARSEPLALSRDGKTLYFVRDRSLWRLDLRKPLPQLLDEVPLPDLPEPPLD